MITRLGIPLGNPVLIYYSTYSRGYALTTLLGCFIGTSGYCIAHIHVSFDGEWLLGAHIVRLPDIGTRISKENGVRGVCRYGEWLLGTAIFMLANEMEESIRAIVGGGDIAVP
jgi:hypothetical protein